MHGFPPRDRIVIDRVVEMCLLITAEYDSEKTIVVVFICSQIKEISVNLEALRWMYVTSLVRRHADYNQRHVNKYLPAHIAS